MPFFCMPFFACNRQVDALDKRQCNLQTIPHEIERYARTLEELLLDMNHIKELPKSLFRLQKLRRLGLSDNDIHRLPPEIVGLQSLVELNISRNDISDLPEDLKACRHLLILDLSSNPIARLPDTITHVVSLTHLSLNDTSLTKLPQDIGKLVSLKSLEVRENHLRSLPSSIVQLTQLIRLDLGQNELDELPTEIGAFRFLQELYADDNSIELLPESIVHCTALEQLDMSSNRLLNLLTDLGDMTSLADLTLSHNCLSYLPSSIGRLKKLSILRLDDNSLLQLTPAIGSCSMLSELYLMQNLISELPSSIGNLGNLQNLNVDKNQLTTIPPLIGNCSSLSLLSFRDNQIEELPMEIGKLSQLRVLDVCNNRLSHLPFTVNVLYNLQALWLSENQSQALLKLQQNVEPKTGMKVLTCYLLPQQSSNTTVVEVSNRLPNRSFVGGPKVHFGDVDAAVHDPEEVAIAGTTSNFGNFERHDTPHPKPNTNSTAVGGGKAVKKASIDGHVIPRVEDSHQQSTTISLNKKPSIDQTNNLQGPSNGQDITNHQRQPNMGNMPRPALKHSTAAFYYQQQQNSLNNGDSYSSGAALVKSDTKNSSSSTSIHAPVSSSLNSISAHASNSNITEGSSNKKFVKTRIVVRRETNHGLGLSIAGGVESNPYIEGDSGLFISKLVAGAPAEKAGLRVGDKVLEINGTSMINERHDVAVQCIQKSPEILELIVTREESQSHLEEPKRLNHSRQDGSTNELIKSAKQASTSSLFSQNVITTSVRLNEKGIANFKIKQEKTLSAFYFIVSSVANSTRIPENLSHSYQNVEEGDRILSINGTNLSAEKSLDDVLSMLCGPPESEIYLVLQRNSVEKFGNIGNHKTGSNANVSQVDNNLHSSSSIKSQKSNTIVNGNSNGIAVGESKSPENPITALQSVNLKNAEKAANNPLTVADLPYGDVRFDGLVEEVRLTRDAKNALGLSIVGGIDHCSHPFGTDYPGVFISKIADNSSAAFSRRLRVGDRILSVNEKDVEKAKHSEAVEALKNSGQSLRILVRHEPQPKGLKEVLFQRKKNEKLGLSICGGINSPPVILSDPTDEGIFIDHIDKKSCAGECIDLSSGLRILEVNDDSLLGCTKNEAAELLKAAPANVRLLVCDGFKIGQDGTKISALISNYASSVKDSYQPQLYMNASNAMSMSANSLQQPSSDSGLSLSQLSSHLPATQRVAESQKNDAQVTKFLTNFSSTTTNGNDTRKVPPPTAPKPSIQQRKSSNEYSGWSLQAGPTRNNIGGISKSGSSTSFSTSAGVYNAQDELNNNNHNNINERQSPHELNNNGQHLKQSLNSSSSVSSSYNSNINGHNNADNSKTTFTKELINSKQNVSNTSNGFTQQDQLERETREVEQQKRREWRQARLASLDEESNRADEIFNNVLEISKSGKATSGKAQEYNNSGNVSHYINVSNHINNNNNGKDLPKAGVVCHEYSTASPVPVTLLSGVSASCGITDIKFVDEPT